MESTITPRQLDALKSNYRHLFSKDPLLSFAAVSLIKIIEQCWESGQMPTDLHDQLEAVAALLAQPKN